MITFIKSEVINISYWTKNKCQEEASKYNTRSEFRKYSHSCYVTAHRNNWLNEICIHMLNKYSMNIIWTKEKCQVEALKYKTRSEFEREKVSAYNASLRNKWLDEICVHMLLTKKIKYYWTKERCLIEAMKYKTKKDFYLNNKSAYNASLKNKWLDDIYKHMKW